MKAYQDLIPLLTKLIKCTDLESLYKKEIKINKRYSLCEISEDFLIYFNHGEKGKSSLQIGFPFPLHIGETELTLPKSQKATFILRGELIREIQRQQLKEISNSFNSIKDPKKFLFNMGKSLNNKKRIIYLDPYTFIGDSYIGLHFMRGFKKISKIENFKMFSNQHSHFPETENIQPYIFKKLIKTLDSEDIIVMPDLIDTHWVKSLKTISKLRNKDTTIFIPGRNLLVKTKRGKITVFHFKEADPLLRAKNIYDYMNDCLKPFNAQHLQIPSRMIEKNSSVFYILLR